MKLVKNDSKDKRIKAKNGLANLWEYKKSKQEKKDSSLGNSLKLEYYYFFRKLVLLKEISLKIIIYGEVRLQCNIFI